MGTGMSGRAWPSISRREHLPDRRALSGGGLSGVIATAAWPSMACGPVRRLALTRLDGDPCEAEGDDAESNARARGHAKVDAHLRRWPVDQCGQPEDQTDDAYSPEHSVAGELRLQHHERQRGEEQKDGGVLDGQQVQPKMASSIISVPSAPGTMVPGTLNSR